MDRRARRPARRLVVHSEVIESPRIGAGRAEIWREGLVRSSATTNGILTVGFIAGLVAFGCGSSTPLTLTPSGNPTGPSKADGVADAGGATTGAVDAAAEDSGAAGTGAAGADVASAGGTAGTGATSDVTEVVAAGSGCGKDAPAALVPGMLVKQTIMTMGTKDANCADAKCGAWTDTREYWVRLPMGYDKNKAYPLLFEGPGCGGAGNDLYNIPAFNSGLIRVGLTPSVYWQAFNATNPKQGCFDDKEGDDSVDFVLYETLWDQLASTICFDRNRAFASGNATGATLANELGCKYAGDAKRPIRGVLANTGGLPTNPMFTPICTNHPVAGFWSHEIGDVVYPFAGNIVAMNRALTVNGCAPAGVTYFTAMFTSFPLPNLPDMTCKRFMGCPDLYPLVVCPLPGNTHGSHDSVVDPGWPAFLALLAGPP
jgi:hypothetical protein